MTVGLGKQRILVTGGAGFIGSHLVEALLHRGDEVAVLDNFDPFYDRAIKHGNVRWALRQPGYKLVEGDIRDEPSLETAFSAGPFTCVVHLAALAGVRPSLAKARLYESVNIDGTTALLDASRQAGNPHFVFGSSSSVYGATSNPPFREDDVADRPCSPYAATKRAGEMVCYAYHHLYATDVTCLRFFTVYGPRQRPEMAIHKFARLIDEGRPVQLYGDGCSRRDYTYVDDIVQGVLAAIDSPSGYRTFNLGTTALTRSRRPGQNDRAKLGEAIAGRALAGPTRRRPLHPCRHLRAGTDLSYKPSTPILEGIDHFVAWYRAQPASDDTDGA